MTLRLALCFHFSQPLAERAGTASRFGYRGLLDTLRRHPELKFNLSLGGALLHALHWLDPQTLESLREGVRAGQFTLLGSTYAGNLLAACDDWDNAQQLALHRALMLDEFGAAPSVFANPGGAWSPQMAPLLAAGGYSASIVEGRMLRRAGVALPLVYGLRLGDRVLGLLWAEEGLAERLCAAAWYRRPELLERGLAELAGLPRTNELLPVLALEADAFGAWAHRSGLDPRADWDGLEQVLAQLERQSDVELCGLENLAEPALFIEGALEGWSAALDRAAALEPAGEMQPFADWRDYLRRSPTVVHFRRLHNAVRNRLNAIGSAWADPGWVAPPPEVLPEACATLYRSAIRTYCLHQFRFGQPGQAGRGQPEWEGVAATFALARAAEIAEGQLQPGAPARASIEDVTGDGEDEILLEDHRHLIVLSHFGGRVVYWFDLVDGAQHVGNPWAVPEGRYRTDVTLLQGSGWLPAWHELPPWDHPQPQQEAAPGRRRAFMAEELTLEIGPLLPYWPLPAGGPQHAGRPVRRRALNDFLQLDDQPVLPADAELDFRLEEGGVTFLRFFGYRLEMTKSVRLAPDGLRVNYRFHNAHDEPHRVRLEIVSEIAPDGQRLLGASPDSLAPVVASGQQPGVRNTPSGTAILSRASRTMSAPPVFSPGLLAIEVAQQFEFNIGPGKAESLTLRLQVLSEHEQGLLRGGLKRIGGWPPAEAHSGGA
jgi:hypothetical protein